MRAPIPAWCLALALALPSVALANDDTDDPLDTGGEQDTDQDTDLPADPGTFRDGSSAAELADEQGGMDCSAAGGAAALFVLFPVAALGLRRRQRP